MPTSLHNWQKLEEELVTRRRIRNSLLDWATEIMALGGHFPAAHHHLLLDKLNHLTQGKFDRLMVLMPPGSAKSTYVSVLFPAWWFTQFPQSSIIAASHTRSLAQYFSCRVRDLIMANESLLGYKLQPGHRAAASWQTTTGGEYYASGVRGGITGRRADLAIIDDPIKSRLDADNPRVRRQIGRWYRSELLTRLKPKARVVLIMTRWHEDDLCGQLQNDDNDSWHLVRLPALAEEYDPLGRQAGEPIWPLWEDRDSLVRKRNIVGGRDWDALFQQVPRSSAGTLFKTSCIAILEEASTGAADRTVRAWDLAGTAAAEGNDPDWTAGVKLTRTAQGHYRVVDVVRMRGSPHEVEELIARTAAADGTSVWIGLPEDPGQAGKSQLAYLAGRLAGYKVVSFRETGAKTTRALPLASQIEAGNLSILKREWTRCFEDELSEFPLGRKDDQVDAVVRAFTTIMQVSETAKMAAIPYFAR